MSDGNNPFLVASAEGVFASAHVTQLPEDQAYDAGIFFFSEVKVKYYKFLKDVVTQPPATVPVKVTGVDKEQSEPCSGWAARTLCPEKGADNLSGA